MGCDPRLRWCVGSVWDPCELHHPHLYSRTRWTHSLGETHVQSTWNSFLTRPHPPPPFLLPMACCSSAPEWASQRWGSETGRSDCGVKDYSKQSPHRLRSGLRNILGVPTKSSKQPAFWFKPCQSPESSKGFSFHLSVFKVQNFLQSVLKFLSCILYVVLFLSFSIYKVDAHDLCTIHTWVAKSLHLHLSLHFAAPVRIPEGQVRTLVCWKLSPQ